MFEFEPAMHKLARAVEAVQLSRAAELLNAPVI